MQIMPTKAHQMIIGLISRKMKDKGYKIVAFDGKEYLFNGKTLKVPPVIKRHRPDLLGYNFKTERVCIGEAKTGGDLFSMRTIEQLNDYAATKQKSTGKYVEAILGILKSSELDLQKLLCKLSLDKNENISYIWLPDELVEND